ncbi:MAG: PAS domain S-box protein [Gemmatimonadetes bacterium]|nr:PAS domain S-box protein [Gemmatimonadota bacterium]
MEWSYEPLIVHRDGVIVYVNAAAVRLFGATSASQLVGTPILDRVHPEYRELSSGRMRKVSAEGIDALLLELVFQQLDGSNLNVEVQQTSVVFDGIPAMLASLHDVTAARQADAAIRLHSAALSAAANGIVITDAKGVIVWTNASFGAMSGYSPEETVGKTFRELINSGAQGPGFYQNLWSTILRGETWRGELVNRRKDGTHYTEAETITPLIGLQGAITHFIAVKQDLTERLVLEEQVRQSQKKWSRWGSWPAESRTTSITCWPSSSVRQNLPSRMRPQIHRGARGSSRFTPLALARPTSRDRSSPSRENNAWSRAR